MKAPTESTPRIGLALGGGGPLGGIYEIGALRALDEALDGLDFNNLDVYVGVNAGSFVAANLANLSARPERTRWPLAGGAGPGVDGRPALSR